MLRIKITRRQILLAGLAVVVFLVAGGWIAASYYSFEARFQRSLPALNAYAAQVMASDPVQPLPALPRRLGAFRTGQAERLPHGFLFFCDYGHPLDANGLAYSTKTLPQQKLYGQDYFQHVEGNWYTFWRP